VTFSPRRGHPRLGPLALLFVLLASASCTDLIEKLKARAKGEETAASDGPLGGGSGKASDPGEDGAGCELPDGTLTAGFTVPKGCSASVERDLVLDDDATLTLEPGAKLRFKTGTGLRVRHGRIVAKGTPDAPVVLTSASKTPSKGDWKGIVFEKDASSGTVFEHAVIEYAGKRSGFHEGAISFGAPSLDGRVAVTSSVLRHNALRAVDARRADSRFAKFDANRLSDNDGTSLRLHPEVVGSIGENVFSEPIQVSAGSVGSSATWPKSDVPFVIEGRLALHGEGKPAVLTLPEGAVLKFAAGARMDVGHGAGGGLVAKRVTFTSAEASPSPGSWVGLIVNTRTSATTIEDSIVEYAGKSQGGGRGAITFLTSKAVDLPSFVVKNTVFRKNLGGAFASREQCGELASPGSGNRSEDAALCVK
jgi:hypothetical protein